MATEHLISILLDSSASTDERDDAAMDLSRCDGEAVENALALVACNQDVPEIVRASCGESLAEIWIRRREINQQVLASLSGPPREEALARLKGDEEVASSNKAIKSVSGHGPSTGRP